MSNSQNKTKIDKLNLLFKSLISKVKPNTAEIIESGIFACSTFSSFEVQRLFSELYEKDNERLSKLVNFIVDENLEKAVKWTYENTPWLILEFVDESKINYLSIDFGSNKSWFFTEYLINKKPHLFDPNTFDWDNKSPLVVGTPFFDPLRFNWKRFAKGFILHQEGNLEEALKYIDEDTKVLLFKEGLLPLSYLNVKNINWNVFSYVFLKDKEALTFAKSHIIPNKVFVNVLVKDSPDSLSELSHLIDKSNIDEYLLFDYSTAAYRWNVPIEEIRRVLGLFLDPEIVSEIDYTILKKACSSGYLMDRM